VQISGGMGCRPPAVGIKNYSPWAITWPCLHDPTFSRFDTIPACDRQTHRHMKMANTSAS